jgi:CheY-like chemotaxis protein
MAAGPTAPAILVVDDDLAVRTIARAFLAAAGYTVMDAASGAEALQVFQRHQMAITVVISDIVMPGMSGPELCDRLLQIQPQLKLLFMSGNINSADLGGIELVPKPFRAHELVSKVQELVNSKTSAAMEEDWRKRQADLDAIEKRLKSELDEARLRYNHAIEELEKLTTDARELGLNTADGAYALHNAAKQHRLATSAYSKAVTRFCDWILHGKFPEE